MKSIDKLHKIIEESLSIINYPKNPSNLYLPISYSFNLGGKRVRPILVLLANQIYGKNFKHALNAAIAIEIFHNFTLLHDDIMDNSVLRRGSPTVHEKWNINTAILSGDTMLVYAYNYLNLLPKDIINDVLNIFNKTAIQVCEGQQLDLDFETKKNVSVNDYLKMIEYKTSVLLAASLKIGALIGGANKKDAENLYDFGINLGIAFQLKDDFLDVFGTKEIFGKKIGGDILSNKKTFLFLKSLELLNIKEKNMLLDLYSNNKIDENEKINQVKNIYELSGVKEILDNLIKEYYKFSMHNLSQINEDVGPIQNFVSILEKRNN
ncbi:MAG: polyprenyl synthetase [Flavobacteriales bacterium]|nr:polyprenyl synthetase [Flavobacteriales bacterium]